MNTTGIRILFWGILIPGEATIGLVGWWFSSFHDTKPKRNVGAMNTNHNERPEPVDKSLLSMPKTKHDESSNGELAMYLGILLLSLAFFLELSAEFYMSRWLLELLRNMWLIYGL